MSRPADIGDRHVKFGKSSAGIPERLLLAHARGELLFIAGAGVSMSAGLPDFRDLVIKIYEALDLRVHSIISQDDGNNPESSDLSDLTDRQQAEIRRFQKGEYDVVLGMLERRLERGVIDDTMVGSQVRGKTGEILRAKARPSPFHRALMRLSDRGGATAIITTNFDLLLEYAARAIRQPVQTYALGGVPRPTRRQEFSGVLHIHGALDPNPKRTSDLIISDQDFGEYYFRRRVVPDLIYDAARLYNLVFVGYSASDPPMRYLLNAVASDVAHFPDLKERFIFVPMDRDDPVALEDWSARGVTPIRYDSADNDHSRLKHTLVQWAEFSSVNGKRSRVDREMKNIVRTARTEAGDEQRDLFDHIIRRSDPQERLRLSALVSRHKADLGWLDAIVDVSSHPQRQARR